MRLTDLAIDQLREYREFEGYIRNRLILFGVPASDLEAEVKCHLRSHVKMLAGQLMFRTGDVSIRKQVPRERR